jgi:hypothetical protein
MATATVEDTSRKPCRFFFKKTEGVAAGCRNGDACTYSHDQAVKDRESRHRCLFSSLSLD